MRLFPWTVSYIIQPSVALRSHMVEVVYSLQFVVKLSTPRLLLVETASYRSLILPAPLSGIQTQRPNRLKMELHLIAEVKFDFEKNRISAAVCLCTLTNDTGVQRPGLFYQMLPESIWLHFTAHFRDCRTLSKELPTMADYSLLFPQRECKVGFLAFYKERSLFVQSHLCVTGSFLSSLNCVLGLRLCPTG